MGAGIGIAGLAAAFAGRRIFVGARGAFVCRFFAGFPPAAAAAAVFQRVAVARLTAPAAGAAFVGAVGAFVCWNFHCAPFPSVPDGACAPSGERNICLFRQAQWLVGLFSLLLA